jgi:hypothetical protein
MKNCGFIKTFLSILVVTLLLLEPLASFAQRGRPGQLRRPVKSTQSENFRGNADSDGRGAFIRWQVPDEAGIIGFNLFRMDPMGLTKVNEEMILANGITGDAGPLSGPERNTFDLGGGLTSMYRVDAIDWNGTPKVLGFITTSFTNNLVPIAGQSFEDYRRAERATRFDEEISEPAYPSELVSEMTASEMPASANTQQWLAGQPALKIRVDREGMYRVTRTQLSNAGFNVNVSGNFWRLFVDGVEQNIVVGPQDSYIDFYGRAQDTRESAEKVYYLVGGSMKGRRMAVRRTRAGHASENSVSFNQTVTRKFRTTYFTTLKNGDEENYFGAVLGNPAGASVSGTLALNGLDPAPHQATVTFRLQGITKQTASQTYEFLVNGQVVGSTSVTSMTNVLRSYSISSSILVEGDNTMSVRALNGGHFIMLDTFSIQHKRLHQVRDQRLKFFTGASKGATVTGLDSASPVIYDITAPDRPTIVGGVTTSQAQGGLFQANVPFLTSRALYAVTDNGRMSPASMTMNIPSTLDSSANQGHLLIITHANFMTEANQWATFRRSQGHTVFVADIEDVFDEYGYGERTTEAIRSFVQRAYSSWADPARYVLLIGDASYDPKNYEGRPFLNFVPTRLFDTFEEETASDDWFADFTNDGVAELPVGRLSVRTTGIVPLYLSKVQSFEAAVAGNQGLEERGTVLAFDEPNGWDFADVSQRVASKTPTGTPNVLVDRLAANSRTTLLNALNAGPFVANYSGHGNLSAWYSATTFFGRSDALAMTNSSRLTLFTMVTCLNGMFHTFESSSLAEALTENPNGGAVASWASTGKTFPDVQDMMINRFFLKLADRTIPRLGDLSNDAKRSFWGSRDVKLSWVIIGDPMLRLR